MQGKGLLLTRHRAGSVENTKHLSHLILSVIPLEVYLVPFYRQGKKEKQSPKRDGHLPQVTKHLSGEARFAIQVCLGPPTTCLLFKAVFHLSFSVILYVKWPWGYWRVRGGWGMREYTIAVQIKLGVGVDASCGRR